MLLASRSDVFCFSHLRFLIQKNHVHPPPEMVAYPEELFPQAAGLTPRQISASNISAAQARFQTAAAAAARQSCKGYINLGLNQGLHHSPGLQLGGALMMPALFEAWSSFPSVLRGGSNPQKETRWLEKGSHSFMVLVLAVAFISSFC